MAAAPAPEQDETAIIRDALKDEYDLEKELGRGGMAVVYKGRDKQLEREVAIKVLPFSLSFDAEFVERFQREARTAGKLEHPNIIPIYRVGKSGRVIYFVMKFIRGKSLSAVIEARGALPVPEAKRMLIEAARALGYAHKHGIVHRDIKPDNIMFDELGQAIVADFGIAKAQSGAKLTGTGMSIGTPHYMSPEQARAQNLDGRSDIYSLGVVAYQALTGHVPFDGEDSFSIGYKHIMEELPTPPLDTAEQREMFVIIRKMMAKKPDDRFQTAEEMIAALESGSPAGMSIADLSTQKTTAIEPMKAPAKSGGVGGGPPNPLGGVTAPLPRASASMGKPADAAPAPPPPAAKKPARPAPPPKRAEKSKGPMIGIAAVAVLALGGAGGYFGVIKPKQDAARAQADSTARADSLRQLARADSIRRDSIARDSADARPGTSRTPAVAANQPGTSRTPPRTPTTPAAPAGAPGTLSLSGVPTGAAIQIDGRPVSGTRIKDVPAGNRRLAVMAQGYARYDAMVTIPPGQTVPHTVRMLPVTNAAVSPPGPATPTPATPPSQPAAPTANCADYRVAVANRNRACYDTGPSPRTAATAQVPPSCTGRVNQPAIIVRVSATGDVTGTPFAYRRSGCAAFDQVAIAAAQDIAFTPAQKGGVAVESFYALPVRPQN
jgi:serine/threonine protein kinase